MKNFILLLLTICSIYLGYGQDEELEQGIALSVIVPDIYTEGLSSAQQKKIQTKVTRMVSNYGMSGLDYLSQYLVYPKFEIFDHREVETQLRNVHTVEAELTLVVMEARTQKVYGTYNMELEGEDFSRSKAINKAIGRAKSKSDDLESFMVDVRTKILADFQNNCTKLYRDAKALIAGKKFEEAMSLISFAPVGISGDCDDNLQMLLEEAYEAHNRARCDELLSDAKRAIRYRHWYYGYYLLEYYMDEASDCFESAQVLKQEIVQSEEIQGDETKLKEGVKTEKVKTRIKKRKKSVILKTSKKVAVKTRDNQMCQLFKQDCH
jgi:hypothetical protein